MEEREIIQLKTLASLAELTPEEREHQIQKAKRTLELLESLSDEDKKKLVG